MPTVFYEYAGNVYYKPQMSRPMVIEPIAFNRPVKDITIICNVNTDTQIGLYFTNNDTPVPCAFTFNEHRNEWNVKFPSINGYPISLLFINQTGIDYTIVVNEYGDVANLRYNGEDDVLNRKTFTSKPFVFWQFFSESHYRIVLAIAISLSTFSGKWQMTEDGITWYDVQESITEYNAVQAVVEGDELHMNAKYRAVIMNSEGETILTSKIVSVPELNENE